MKLEEETVWLTQAQMAELFQTSKQKSDQLLPMNQCIQIAAQKIFQ